MQVTVFGATGKVGRLVVEEALRRGYDVVAFVHSHDPFSKDDKLTVFKGDIYNAGDVSGAVKGSDAIISCLGSWGTPKKDVLSSAMQAIIPAMDEQKIKRIVTLTGYGTNEPGQPLNFIQRMILGFLSPFPAGKVFRDGLQHMDMLAASDLDWTIVRSPVMSNRGSSAYQLSTKMQRLLVTASRTSVARCLLDQLSTDEYSRQAPTIYRR